MNMKRKLWSVLSLVLALSMLLSTAATALDLNDSASSSEPASSEDSSNETSGSQDSTPVQEPEEADGTSSNDSGSEGQDSTTNPGTPSDTTEETDETTSPDLLAAPLGWSHLAGGYVFRYTQNGQLITAGSSAAQVVYISEKTTVSGTSTQMEAGFYYFKNSYWTESFTAGDAARYAKIAVVTHRGSSYTVSETYDYRMLNVTKGVGTLYSGRHRDSDGKYRRYDQGVGRNGYALGTESEPNLYYYVDGDYQTATSKEKVTGYITFEGNGKLYYGSGSKYYAVPFTGRYTGSDKVRRRYEKGERYNGYGLGTESTPNLYFYVEGDYTTSESLSKLKSPGTNGYFKYGSKTYYGGDGWYKYAGKWYHTTTASLKKYNAALANKVYRVYKPDGKLYYYSNGSASLYTGVYNGDYYTKGVKSAKSGWVKVGGYWYYFKSGDTVTGWNYLSRNGKSYYYYFKSDGKLVEDLFSYFGSSYLSKKMIIQVNRTTHTADILLYSSSKKSYCIAAKSFVCSTSEKSSDFRSGTYNLYKNSSNGRSWRRRWFTFTNPDTKKTSYYQYGTFIIGTDSWFHSSSYSKKNIRTLNVGNYNKLGTNQTYYCIRLQVVNTKIVYDAVGRQGNAKVKVKLYTSSNKGPYGQITLANTTGKLSSKYNYDPTDPAI